MLSQSTVQPSMASRTSPSVNSSSTQSPHSRANSSAQSNHSLNDVSRSRTPSARSSFEAQSSTGDSSQTLREDIIPLSPIQNGNGIGSSIQRQASFAAPTHGAIANPSTIYEEPYLTEWELQDFNPLSPHLLARWRNEDRFLMCDLAELLRLSQN